MRRLARYAVVAYLLLLAASHGSRWLFPHDPRSVHAARERVLVPAGAGTSIEVESAIEVAWLEWSPERAEAPRPPVVLLHGSPGDAADFRRFAPAIAEHGYRVLAPDLPGFGASTRELADYSMRAHAGWVDRWLQELGLPQAHLVGFSLGGGVALELWRLDRERVASITLLASIGVQELELLGNHHLNHLVHGLQLAALWLLHEATPHFGLLDRLPLDHAYARNFWDSDQRPLRPLLERLDVPTAIVHGRSDPLVPVAAAVEHHRLVPQSELLLLDASHFFVFERERSEPVARWLTDFWSRVDHGLAATRATATPERLAQAAAPWNPRSVPPWEGPALLAIVLLLALATFVSEDLTCLGAGLLVAQGRLGLLAASLGCFLGIVIGDFAIFWIGRLIGRPALRMAPLRWWVTEEGVERSSAWLRRRGAVVIALSRFLPGARVPTYLAAGLLRTSFRRFALYFLAAAAVWTPLVVGIASQIGELALEWLATARYAFALALLGLFLVMLTVQRVILPLTTHRGRRRWVGRWRRFRHWEFWPPWLLYPPVVLYLLWLGLKHRSPTLFTAANPAIPAGGFVGESKAQILDGLAGSGVVPPWRLLPADLDQGEAVVRVLAFLADEALEWPLVLKPDAGQRGQGVAIVRGPDDVRQYFARPRPATLVQAYAPGREFGIFYWRWPEAERGSLFSITEKLYPSVIGDGERSLEELILDDPRAVAIADVYVEQQEDPRRIPAAGERVPLAEIGAHSRGTVFLDATRLASEELRAEIDRIVSGWPGFDIGRFDVRTADAATLQRGGPLQVIELNGVTSEATHIYDRRHGVIDAWATLCRQWRLTFEIAARRRAAGTPVTSIRRLLAMVREFRQQQRRLRRAT